jgi:PRTRC genetic system protein B
MALVLYEEENDGRSIQGRADDGHKYFEAHEIDKAGRMLEGHPLRAETLAGIARIYHEETKPEIFEGFFPECLLHFEPALHTSGYKMIWWRPACTQHLHFREDLHIPSGVAPVPAMVWSVKAGRLSVFALASDERPAADTKLLNAPFHNVSSSGGVCLGSAKAPRASRNYQSQMEYWETLFWKSEFTHLNNQQTVKGNLNLIWKALIEKPGRSWADLKLLLPSSVKSLNALLK